MKAFFLIALLAQPAAPVKQCTAAKPVAGGSIVDCAGILWPVDASRAALKCKRVDLPKCRADSKLKIRITSAERDAFLVRAVAAETMVHRMPKPLPAWIWPTVTAAAFLAGTLAGGDIVARV